MKKVLPAVIVLLILVSGGAFYGGMKYSSSQRAAAFSARGGAAGFRSGAGGVRSAGAGRGGFASGEILSKDSNSVTIKLADGGSQIIFFSSSTQIMKAASGSLNDLVTGQNIMINGSANADGSVTAQSIQLRPVMSGMTSSSAK